jgi:hypothetical protein
LRLLEQLLRTGSHVFRILAVQSVGQLDRRHGGAEEDLPRHRVGPAAPGSGNVVRPPRPAPVVDVLLEPREAAADRGPLGQDRHECRADLLGRQRLRVQRNLLEATERPAADHLPDVRVPKGEKPKNGV